MANNSRASSSSARPGSYRSVDFSVPEGADPMGIGVPDLGKSSYDPLATIRRGWEKTREERLMKEAERREDYQKFMEKLPTFESVNEKVASKLNSKAVEMGKLAHQRYKSGAWSPFAKTEEGLSTERELGRMEKELVQEGSQYNAMKEKYKIADQFIRDPANYDKIDWEVTLPRIESFTDAEDIEGMSNALQKPLVALKPDPVDFHSWLNDQIGTFIPGEDQEIVGQIFDPETGKFKVKTKEYTNPERAAKGMIKIYNTAEDQYKNWIDRRYELAPEEEKVTKDDVPVGTEDWFASKFVPEYGEKLDLKMYSVSDQKGSWWGFLPGKGSDGSFDLKDYEEVVEIATPPAGEGEGDIPIVRQYFSAATIPLQSITKQAFVMPNSPRTINAETGEKTEGGRSAFNYMDSINILPVAKETVVVPMEGGQTRTIPAGERIPKDVQRAMGRNKQLDKIKWTPYLKTLTSNKQVSESLEYKGIPLGTQTQSFNQTTIRPWNEAVQYVKAASMEKDIDINPLIDKIDEITNQLNVNVDLFYQDLEIQEGEDPFNKMFDFE